jgi:hypothetical protein
LQIVELKDKLDTQMAKEVKKHLVMQKLRSLIITVSIVMAASITAFAQDIIITTKLAQQYFISLRYRLFQSFLPTYTYISSLW